MTTLRVCTYNHQKGVGATSAFEARWESPQYLLNLYSETEDEANKMLQQIRPDILGVQEICGRCFQNRLWLRENHLEMFREKIGHKKSYYGQTVLKRALGLNWLDQGIGLSIGFFSVVEYEEVSLPKANGENRLLQKLVLRISGKEVCVWHTHLEYYDAESQRLQLAYLLDNVLKRSDRPGLIMGDFNLRKPIDYDLLKVDGWEVALPDNPSHGYWDPNTGEWNDAIMYNEHFELVDFAMPLVEISDHCPLVADLRIK